MAGKPRVPRPSRRNNTGRHGGHPRRDYGVPHAGGSAHAVEFGALGSGRLQERAHGGCWISLSIPGAATRPFLQFRSRVTHGAERHVIGPRRWRRHNR
eukprot:1632612-Pyramimonas_sp.AAC.1